MQEHLPPEVRASDADRDRVLAVLRTATGDGRLTPDEHEARVGAALTARTIGDLAVLTADLPSPAAPAAAPAAALVPAQAALDVIRLEQKYGKLRRTGRWTVPRQLELRTRWCDIVLDFTQALISHDTVRLDLDAKGGSVTLVAAPGMAIEDVGLNARYTDVDLGWEPPAGEAPRVRLLVGGKMRYGSARTRPRGWPG